MFKDVVTFILKADIYLCVREEEKLLSGTMHSYGAATRIPTCSMVTVWLK